MMVVDTIHIRSDSALHPTYRVFGHDIVIDIPYPTLILAIVGALFLARYVFSVFRLFLELTVIPGININTFKSKQVKSWAIVTGSTSGIGTEFARQLAKKGFGIILVGRRPEALGKEAAEIETKYRVQTKTVAVDFSSPQDREKSFAELAKYAQDLDVAILINNAATSHEMPTPFVDTSFEEAETILQTNMLATIHLTRQILPALIARSKGSGRPKSLILNIGSMDGRIPPTLLAVYGATKGGLSTFTTAVAEEVKDQKVVVKLVLPAFVVSNMSKIRRTSLTVPSAAAFVASTLSSIGLPRGAQGRPHVMTPYWAHALLDYATGFGGYVTEMVGIYVVDYMHKDIRRRALRKKAREAAGKKAQ